MNAPLEPRMLFAALVTAEPLAVLGVVLVPLLRRAPSEDTNALLLEEGIRLGLTAVEEVSAQGVVSEVRVRHRGTDPLLVLQGEEILGAKQNRSFNSSFVIAPGTDVVLPVSCVEQGRWRHESASFRAAATTLAPELRARKLKRVTASVRTTGRYDADQRGVWSDVREYMDATGTFSATSAYEDARQSRADEAERIARSVEPLPDQVGLAVVRGGRVVMLDVFGSPRLFARAFRKCLRGALASVALGSEPESRGERPARETVHDTLRELAHCDAVSARAPSGGDTVTGAGARTAWAAAVWNGRVYHCAAAA